MLESSRQAAEGSEPRDTFTTTRPIPACCLLLAAFCLLVTTGCVRRSLTIRTDPSEAMVYVNDVLKGPSPVTYDFQWYGWHRVLIRKDGYERIEDRKQLRAPVYLWIPFDLVMELLPFKIRDERTWSYTLAPANVLPAPRPPETFVPPAKPAAESAPAADASATTSQEPR